MRHPFYLIFIAAFAIALVAQAKNPVKIVTMEVEGQRFP